MRNLLMILMCLRYQYVATNCPSKCSQIPCLSGILLCSEGGLDLIPEIPPPKTTKVIIEKQTFLNSVLRYKNLSKYGPEEISLKSLTIHDCGITEIESESFSHLIHLTEMDLSNNELKTINPKTFKALNLKSLKLDGNRLLKLTVTSLQGLVVSSLSLANCQLSELKFDSIKEISGHLIKFNLSQNNLKTLSFRFYLLFKRLEEIRLEQNRWKCDCRIIWLNKILKQSRHALNRFSSQTTCSSPILVKGKTISKLEESQFLCPKPDLKAIGVDISPKSAVLYCSSSPQSDNQVYWQLKHLHNDSVYKIQELTETLNNASVKVLKKSQSDRFSCIVTNENGNVTVDLNIRWPEKSEDKNNESQSPILIFTTTNSSSRSTNSQQLHYLFIKQFTFLEMILSIGSTFVVTTITFSLIYLFLSRKMNINIGKHSPSKCGYQSGIYSEPQIYDLPRYSSPLKSFQQTAQLYDFKTQKLITQDIH